MMGQTMSRDTERGSIGDEAVFLRIQMLQKGLLQFTDSTNAYRLVREFGKDICYIAPKRSFSSGFSRKKRQSHYFFKYY